MHGKHWREHYPAGAQVSYVTTGGQKDVGTVVGNVLHDPFVATTWVPVRPARCADDTAPLWIRSSAISGFTADT